MFYNWDFENFTKEGNLRIMKSTIVVISNTFPYSGEPFLKTELDYLPRDMKYYLFPFFTPNSNDKLVDTNAAGVYRYAGQESLWIKLGAMMASIKNLLSKRELSEAIHKNGRIRNIIKALKFAYISELRVLNIIPQIDNEKTPLIFYSYWMYEVGYVAARLKEEFPGSSFITRCHGYDLYEERHPNRYLPYRRFILESADRVFPISKNGKDYLSDKYNHEFDEKIVLSRLGTKRLSEIRRLNDDQVTLVSCSNLIPLKRVNRIIDALNEEKGCIKWVHFGDGVLRQQLEVQAKSLPENIHAEFKGYVPNWEVQEFFATHAITAFINVSESEGVPVSIMEAQSYGIPVIATDVGGTSELVHDDENGVLLNKDFTTQDLLNAIKKVSQNHMQFSEGSLRTWETMSDAAVTTKKFYAQLRNLEE